MEEQPLQINKPKKNGFIIIFVGRQGAGKTPIIKRLSSNSEFKNKIVFDVNLEYESTDYTIHYDVEVFNKNLLRYTDSFIIYEDATGFINSFKELEMSRMLTKIQHNRNVLCLVFHSLMDIPNYIENKSRFIVITKVNDDLEKIKHQRPRLYELLIDREGEEDIWIDLNKQ